MFDEPIYIKTILCIVVWIVSTLMIRLFINWITVIFLGVCFLNTLLTIYVMFAWIGYLQFGRFVW